MSVNTATATASATVPLKRSDAGSSRSRPSDAKSNQLIKGQSMIHMTSATAQVLATPPGPIVVPVQRHGHTERDFQALTDAGVDPASTQPREWPTSCWCGERTWHQMASCDAHYVAPAAAVRALAVQA